MNDLNKYDYHKLTPFKWFVLENFPFIEADFDAITNYKLYCKIVEYLNKVIDSQNNVGQEVENLSQAFINLQNYVNNYFENLDVQEEINNKLDEMAEQGTLQEIITAYLQIRGLLAFNNVNEMINSTNLVNGSFAVTYGYSELNDGGKSYYKIRNITNEDIVDGTHIIAMSNNQLVAELINSFEINPENFSGANDTEKVQNAINYAVSLYNADKPVIINLNRLFTITQSLSIETLIKRIPFVFNSQNGGGFYKTTSGLLFDTSKNYVSDIEFKNITFKSTNGSGLLIMTSPKFINIKFLNCCFKDIDKCIFSETYLQSITFDNCLITGGNSHFIEFSGSYFLNITNCIIEHRNNSYLVYQNYDATTIYNSQFYTNICNNIIEGFSGENSGFIYITGYELINICNNYFESLFNSIVHNCKQLGGTLNIKNNRLFQGSSITTKETSGLLKMLPYDTNILRMGNINFEGNRISNTYAIYFDMEYINYVNGQSEYYLLNYKGNYVASNITGNFNIDGRNTQMHFNILPIFRNPTTGTSKYYRTFWNIQNKITWNETFEINEKTYNVYFIFKDGRLIVNIIYNTSISTDITEVNIYFGFDLYIDDLYTVSQASKKCNILSYSRQGSTNNKYLQVFAQAIDNTANKDIYATIELCGRRG